MIRALRSATRTLCADCGADTQPCTHRRGCRHAGRWERYVVHDAVWHEAGGVWGDRMFLCVGCLESRLGRELVPEDLPSDLPVNEPDSWDTIRLVSRRSGLPESVLAGRWPP